ncbi:MAG: exodeoxyribonuclease VII large subunit [Campylobacterota bacterium]|nr:exodeoxyribonuclease VII large subunit [Campylobacterota bacterium]
MNTPLSVSSLNTQIKSLLETTFSTVYVEGEISNLTYHNSGHIYFSIKDSSSTVSCVMFRGNAQYLKFRLEVGAKIVISGSITVYAPRGNYQLLCTKIEPSGIGTLALAYEQLKTKLQIKGYFDSSLKKTLPKYPKKIAVVTSNTGAAIEDMKKVLSKRWPLAKMILIPTLVQGSNAKEDIVSSIQRADQLHADVMIVGRGGGSIEDLWAFNEQCVAEAIFEAHTPIISAVGHESDLLISDFVADLRAATPSNAIELCTPDCNDLRFYLDNLSLTYAQYFSTLISVKQQNLNHLCKSYDQHSLQAKFSFMQQEIVQLQQHYKNIINPFHVKKSNELKLLMQSFHAHHPDKKSSIGYVQTTQDNKIIDISQLDIDDQFSCENSKLQLYCKVLSKKLF